MTQTDSRREGSPCKARRGAPRRQSSQPGEFRIYTRTLWTSALQAVRRGPEDSTSRSLARSVPRVAVGFGDSAPPGHPALRSQHHRAARLSTRPAGARGHLTSRARAAAVASGDRPRGSDRHDPAPLGLRLQPRVAWCPRSPRRSGRASDSAAPVTARARALTYPRAPRQV